MIKVKKITQEEFMIASLNSSDKFTVSDPVAALSALLAAHNQLVEAIQEIQDSIGGKK